MINREEYKMIEPTPAFIDPLDKYNAPDEQLLEACGLLPYWVVDDRYMDLPLKEALDKQYQFGLYEITGGKVDSLGIYKYPEDPELYPILVIVRKDETFFQYPYGMVAIVQEDGSSFVCRMD